MHMSVISLCVFCVYTCTCAYGVCALCVHVLYVHVVCYYDYCSFPHLQITKRPKNRAEMNRKTTNRPLHTRTTRKAASHRKQETNRQNTFFCLPQIFKAESRLNWVVGNRHTVLELQTQWQERDTVRPLWSHAGPPMRLTVVQSFPMLGKCGHDKHWTQCHMLAYSF